LVRDSNEDSFFVDENLGLFIVADGMGGHNAGEVASAMAVRSLPIHIMNGVQRGRDAFVVLKEALIAVDHAILDISQSSPSWDNMGTTAVVALVDSDTAVVAHVGDSRCYMINHDGIIRLLTEDHSFVAQWVAQGMISAEEARRHPARHGIFMALGVGDELQPSISAWPFEPGDRILLCSDGLTDMLLDEEIEKTIQETHSVQDACDKLVDQALAQGGVDNVTVVLVANAS
jgi:protein phosphatase